MDERHVCVSAQAICNGGYWDCIDATVYGPCGYETCGGVCSDFGSCTCDCHEAED